MSKNTIEFYKVGTKVRLADDINATVIGVNIGANNNIIYSCGWWNSGSYSTADFNADQIESVFSTEKTKIGFV